MIVGVVTGLRAEARCLGGPSARVACSGGSAERARAEATRLVGDGARGLVSFGLAGGLVARLRPGDLLLAGSVASPGGARIPTTQPWREAFRDRLRTAGVEADAGAIAGSEHIVATAADKRALAEATGAVAVDMESHEVGAVASAAGIPFLVVRAVADPSDQAMPQIAREALTPSGGLRLAAIAGGLVRAPGELSSVLRLGRQSAQGLATLRRAARLAGPQLAFDAG